MYVNRPIMSWDTQDLESVGNRMRSLSPACVTPAVVCSASVQIVHSIGIIQCQALSTGRCQPQSLSEYVPSPRPESEAF